MSYVDSFPNLFWSPLLSSLLRYSVSMSLKDGAVRSFLFIHSVRNFLLPHLHVLWVVLHVEDLLVRRSSDFLSFIDSSPNL